MLPSAPRVSRGVQREAGGLAHTLHVAIAWPSVIEHSSRDPLPAQSKTLLALLRGGSLLGALRTAASEMPSNSTVRHVLTLFTHSTERPLSVCPLDVCALDGNGACRRCASSRRGSSRREMQPTRRATLDRATRARRRPRHARRRRHVDEAWPKRSTRPAARRSPPRRRSARAVRDAGPSRARRSARRARRPVQVALDRRSLLCATATTMAAGRRQRASRGVRHA